MSSLAPCPLCGTHTAPGTPCLNCGTPTPAPAPEPGTPPPAPAPASPTAYGNQWEAILDKLRRVAAPKYKVKGILGYGGMAGVYLAEEPRLGRNVAIKVMAPGLMMDPQLVERFGQEARTIAQLSHPNIVTIYEVDEREDLHWFTMTFVAGRTLGQVLSEATEVLPISVVRAWLYQIGDALAYAHHHGIVHRDIKPGNVLLDLRGNALVTDFGIAKVADYEAGLTRTGMLVGTPAYMSPEQCSSGRVTGASDQYSLGAVAYQMLTGQPPFAGATLTVLQAHLTQPVRPIVEMRPDCPVELAEAVFRMLEKTPEDRFPTISDALSAAGASAPGLGDPIREELAGLAAQAAAITVAGWRETVGEGTREQIRVLAVDGTGRVLSGRRVDARSANAQVAVMSDAGQLQAFSPGATQLVLTCGSASTTLPLVVEADPVRGIEVHPAAIAVPAEGRKELDTIVHDLDGTRLDDRAILWSSSDPSIARVDHDGVVEGVRPGLATITAVTGGQAAICTVTVTEPALSAAAPRRAQRLTSSPVLTPPPATTTRPTSAPKSPIEIARPAEPRSPSKRLALIGGTAAVLLIAAIGMFIAGGGDDVPEPGPAEPTGTAQSPTTGNPAVEPTSNQPVTTRVDTPTGPVVAGPPPVTSAPAPRPGNPQPNPPPVTRPTVETPPAPLTGTLEISGSLPSAATITIRDERGSTRTIIGRSVVLPPGTYVVGFRAPNYENDQRTIAVSAGEHEVWSPEIRAAKPPDPPPTRDPASTQPRAITAADQAAIEQAIDGFVTAFGNRDANTVVPLLPSELKVYDTILRDRSHTQFSARLESRDAATGSGDTAHAGFVMRLSFRDPSNTVQNTPLRLVGNFQRTSSGWRLTSLMRVR